MHEIVLVDSLPKHVNPKTAVCDVSLEERPLCQIIRRLEFIRAAEVKPPMHSLR